LQQILLRKLKSSEVFLGRKLSKIEMRTNGCQLEFTNGETLMSSMVLGADGLHSTVRNQLFPNNTIRNAKQICWRGIANYNLPEEFQHELNEAWGSLIRFGFVQIAPKKVYWYALQSFTKSAADFSVAHLIDYFLDYNDVVKEIIKSTNTSQIHKAEILDLKPTNKWFSNNICLLGDAAHATTPNLGQGACQAIEDAFVLSECLAKYDDTSKAFEEFQKLRIVKAHQVVKTSWTVGKIAHVKNPILAGLRNQILKLTPSSFSRKQNEFIFKLAEL
jgi:2-polyprenyl-6-methoxyphenol hydroxylase-like FAD-dependent oxidoreductase